MKNLDYDPCLVKLTRASFKCMRARCNNPRNAAKYGAKGIVVCERWACFANFLDDMGLRPSALHTIDRIDGNGIYEKSNCRWATWAVQLANRRPFRRRCGRIKGVRFPRGYKVAARAAGKTLAVRKPKPCPRTRVDTAAWLLAVGFTSAEAA